MNILVFRIHDGDFAGWADWDCAPHPGDGDFVQTVLSDDSKTIVLTSPGPEPEQYFRPKDADAWKAAGTRWGALADILSRDPELWVYPCA